MLLRRIVHWSMGTTRYSLQGNVHHDNLARFSPHMSERCRHAKGSGNSKQLLLQRGRGVTERSRTISSLNYGPHLNPVTINPIICMSHLGPFFCPRDSEALSEQFRAKGLQPCFEAQNGRPRKHPGTSPGRPNSPKTDIRPTGFNMTGFRCPGN